MQEVTNKRDINEVLVDLEQILRDERKYLIALDADSIDALNPMKTSVEHELLTFSPQELLSQRPRIEAVRIQLQENLVLLVHAREQVQLRLGIEPQTNTGTRNSNSTPAAGVRLNLKG
jgi:hypothetical protein